MTVQEFKDLLIFAARKEFPEVNITFAERRNITVEARITVTEDTFIEVYYNIISEKKSYTLIKNSQRIFGYDNYKYWHVHPFNSVGEHIPCNELSVEVVFEEIRKIIAGGL